MIGAGIKIMYEEQLVDPPIDNWQLTKGKLKLGTYTEIALSHPNCVLDKYFFIANWIYLEINSLKSWLLKSLKMWPHNCIK